MTSTLVEHGTYGRYQKGCKCPDCRDANAAYHRAWRASKNGLPEGDPRHGTIHGYTGFGCRCEACRQARRDSDHCPGCRCKARTT